MHRRNVWMRLPLLLTLVSSTFFTYNVECLETPTRFFYGNKRSAESSNTEQHIDTSLKLIEEQREKDSIPMEFYKKLDNVTDISEFIERFVDKDTVDPKFGLQETYRRSVERANVVIPKSANCMPENTVVPLTPLDPSNDPKIIYYPKCTRVKRCGGCCGSELMSCQPTETETINFEVTKYHYGDKTPIRGKEIIVVEQHTKCKCGCRIKAEDCNSYQIYRPELCRCVCTNEDALQKCLSEEYKYWDDTTCRCVCRDSQSCTTGTIFDESQCKCIDAVDGGSATLASSALLDRRRFIVKAIPIEVEPDNSTLYSL